MDYCPAAAGVAPLGPPKMLATSDLAAHPTIIAPCANIKWGEGDNGPSQSSEWHYRQREGGGTGTPGKHGTSLTRC